MHFLHKLYTKTEATINNDNPLPLGTQHTWRGQTIHSTTIIYSRRVWHHYTETYANIKKRHHPQYKNWD